MCVAISIDCFMVVESAAIQGTDPTSNVKLADIASTAVTLGVLQATDLAATVDGITMQPALDNLLSAICAQLRESPECFAHLDETTRAAIIQMISREPVCNWLVHFWQTRACSGIAGHVRSNIQCESSK